MAKSTENLKYRKPVIYIILFSFLLSVGALLKALQMPRLSTFNFFGISLRVDLVPLFILAGALAVIFFLMHVEGRL